ncbi:MAG: ComEC/Rec2 family competence protein [Elusimicrobia bacterium]|nr:ComEC/Rec2 family competence protein [Elusimicrobiota bacterium]
MAQEKMGWVNLPPVYPVTVLFILGIGSRFLSLFALVPVAFVLSFFVSSSVKWFFVYFFVFVSGFFYTGWKLRPLLSATRGGFVRVKGVVTRSAPGKFVLKSGRKKFLVFPKSFSPEPGDRVAVKGKFLPLEERKNFSSVNWKRINLAKGICGRILPESAVLISKGKGFVSFFWHLKKTLEGNMEKYFSPEDASYLKGFIFGDKTALPPEIIRNFRRTGMSHLLAVSGLHIGLFTAVFGIFLSFFIPSRVAAGLSVPFAFLYAFMCGATPSSVRAATMFAFFSLSLAIGRRGALAGALFASALLLLCVNPLALFDISFQLSYLATAGIIFLYPFFFGIFGKFLPKPAASLFAVGFACQFFIIPVINENFLAFSPIAVFVNPFVIPLAGLVVFSVFVFFLAGFLPFAGAAKIGGFISLIFSSACSLFVSAIAKILKFAASFGFASVSPGHISIFFWFAYYVFVAAISLRRKRIFIASSFLFLFAFLFEIRGRSTFELHVPKFEKGDVCLWRDLGRWYQVGVPSDINGNLDAEYLRFLKFYGVSKLSGYFAVSSAYREIAGMESLADRNLCEKFYVWKYLISNDALENFFVSASDKIEPFEKSVILGKTKVSFENGFFVLKPQGMTLAFPSPGSFFWPRGIYINGRNVIIPEDEPGEVILTAGGKIGIDVMKRKKL